MNHHTEWCYECERYSGNVFIGDDSLKKIIGCGRVKLLLNDGRIKTILGVLHIPNLARNLISISKMVNRRVNILFEKDRCKIVRGVMVFIWGV